jgi:hypothetical protein
MLFKILKKDKLIKGCDIKIKFAILKKIILKEACMNQCIEKINQSLLSLKHATYLDWLKAILIVSLAQEFVQFLLNPRPA